MMEKFKDFVRFACEMAATPGGHIIGLCIAATVGAVLAACKVPKGEDIMLAAFIAWIAKNKEKD